jgi:hypothetical protein
MDAIAPPVMIQTAIARAVHRAIVKLTRSDGYGYCYLYAVAGCRLASEVVEREYELQAGTLSLLAQPPDGWLVVRSTQEGLSNGAYHCWFGRLGPTGEIGEIVDLSARHYRRLADSNRSLAPGASAPIRWAWPAESPDHVWITGNEHPSWVGLAADLPLTQRYVHSVALTSEYVALLHRLARTYFDAGSNAR